MIQVKDAFGNIVHGHFKNDDGSIVVKNNDAYTKAITFKNRMDNMETKIDELNKLVNKLIENMQNE